MAADIVFSNIYVRMKVVCKIAEKKTVGFGGNKQIDKYIYS
jgi:hypothetical protein